MRTVFSHPLAVEGVAGKMKTAMPADLEKFMKENADTKGLQLLENVNAFVQVSETKRQRTMVQAGGDYLTEEDLKKKYSKKIVDNMKKNAPKEWNADKEVWTYQDRILSSNKQDEDIAEELKVRSVASSAGSSSAPAMQGTLGKGSQALGRIRYDL